MRYYVFHAEKPYCRCIETTTSFEARKIVARACSSDVTDFYAVRKDLMTARDWAKATDDARI